MEVKVPSQLPDCTGAMLELASKGGQRASEAEGLHEQFKGLVLGAVSVLGHGLVPPENPPSLLTWSWRQALIAEQGQSMSGHCSGTAGPRQDPGLALHLHGDLLLSLGMAAGAQLSPLECTMGSSR